MGQFSDAPDWLVSVIQSYGNLDKFPDARTVRIMLKFSEDNLREITRIWGHCLKTNGAEEWRNIFAAEIVANGIVRRQCKRWLRTRDLPR